MDTPRFSDRIRAAAKRLGTFTASELADAVEVATAQEKKNVSAYIRNFVARGEMARVNNQGPSERARGCSRCPELYRYTPKPGRVTNRQRMWNVVRHIPAADFSLRDITQLTDIGYGQAKRFCSWLCVEGWAVRTSPGRFRRARPMPVTVPVDKRESARASLYHKTRRAAVRKALEEAARAIERAQKELET